MKANAKALPNTVLHARLGRMCVAVTGASASELIAKAEETVRDDPFIEFRLDYLDQPVAAIPKLKQFLGSHSQVTAIATCRRAANGGKFKGTLAAELDILEKAAAAGCQLVDLEIESAEKLKAADVERLRGQANLILSHHDYAVTKNLDSVFERMTPFKADILKVVSTAKALSDNLTMMHFLERTRDRASMVGICMGDYGIISRVLGLRAGSIFTFAAANQGEETGPGQIAARTLRDTYRIDQVDAATKIYGVAGDPVKHSLSPLMMNTAFRRENVNAVFLALQSAKATDVLNLVREIPLHGLSVTMPLKQEILKHLERTDPLSLKIGASNTIVRAHDGKLYGFNTDVAGVLQPLEKRMELRNAKILVLGAGGAARAAVFGLRDRGAEVSVLNRDAEKGKKLAREAKAKTARRDQLAKATWDVIINATPVGMTGYKTQTWLDPKEINSRYVFDMVYTPVETPLLRAARQKGIQVITGIEMFVQQGAEQFQIWTGKPAPKEEMLRTVVHALQQRDTPRSTESR